MKPIVPSAEANSGNAGGMRFRFHRATRPIRQCRQRNALTVGEFFTSMQNCRAGENKNITIAEIVTLLI